MEIFIKAAAGVLIAMILGAILSKQSKDITLLLTILTCSMILLVAVQHFEPVLDFFDRLKEIGELDANMIKILLKTLGIGLLGEITSMVCIDGGNAALGKTIQLMGSCVILWISLPLFEALIELIEETLKFV